MKNKVLVRVYVPCIDFEYEIYIPVNESIRKVITLIVNSVYELSDENININNNYCLFNPDTMEFYKLSSIVRDTDITNSKKIILI